MEHILILIVSIFFIFRNAIVGIIRFEQMTYFWQWRVNQGASHAAMVFYPKYWLKWKREDFYENDKK